MADPAAEARTEAGLTGAAGATRTVAVFMEVELVRVISVAVAADTLAQAVRVEARTYLEAEVAAEAAVDSAAGVHSAVVRTVGRRARREGIRRECTVAEVMDGRLAAIMGWRRATATLDPEVTGMGGPLTTTVETQRMAGQITATDTVVVTAGTTVPGDPAVPTGRMVVRGRVALTETPTRTQVSDGTAATTGPHQIAAIRG